MLRTLTLLSMAWRWSMAGCELLGEEVLSDDQREAVILATYSVSELVEALKMAARQSAF